LINRKYASSIKSITKVSARIISINIESNPELTIVCTYAPTNTSDEDDKDLKFYKEMI